MVRPFALLVALSVGAGLSYASGLVVTGSTSSFASQRSSVSSGFKTTPSGIVTNMEGNQVSNTGSDSIAFTASSIPNSFASVDTYGTGTTWGGLTSTIQAQGTGFAPVALSGFAQQDAASASRATSNVWTQGTSLPPCYTTCW